MTYQYACINLVLYVATLYLATLYSFILPIQRHPDQPSPSPLLTASNAFSIRSEIRLIVNIKDGKQKNKHYHNTRLVHALSASSSSFGGSGEAAFVPPNSCNSSSNNNKLLILGFGRVGNEVAHQACSTHRHFRSVTGTVRKTSTGTGRSSSSRSRSMAKKNEGSNANGDGVVSIIPFGIDDDDDIKIDEINGIIKKEMTGFTHILITIPPNRNDIINNRLNQFYDTLVHCIATNNNDNSSQSNNSPSRYWIGIISTTGVYGNHNGEYVTEESKCYVSTAASSSSSSSLSQHRYLKYEEMWKERINQTMASDKRDHIKKSIDMSLCIFRSAGIYGNEQSAIHTIYKKGYDDDNTSVNEGNSNLYDDITNRIHVHDLAAAILASMMTLPQQQQRYNDTNSGTHAKTTTPINVYNVADDLPESRTIVMQYAFELLQRYNVTLPSLKQNNNSSCIRSDDTMTTISIRNQRRSTDQKRINNTKMKRDLLQELTFPTYKEGLEDIIRRPNQPWWT